MDFGTTELKKIGDSYYFNIKKVWVEGIDFLKENIGEDNKFELEIDEKRKIIILKLKEVEQKED